jgi:threonine synthase
MTTVTDANVHNVAVKGTFDDCQVRVSQGKDGSSPLLESIRTS